MSKPARVYGPYRAYKGFRLVVIDGNARQSVIVATFDEAERMKADIAGALRDRIERTVGEAIAEYRQQLTARGVVTAVALCRSIERFLGAGAALRLTGEQATARYEAETRRLLPSKDRAVAAAAHQCILGRTKRFYAWAMQRGYVARNPFAEVKPIGRANVGKQQFRIDEARRFSAHAMHQAESGDLGAAAAITTLLLGLRASEVLGRSVRDLDDDGRILWITRGKTRNARRRLQVPDELRPLLRKLAAGKGADGFLFSAEAHPYSATWLWVRVQKLCDEAGVPRVSTHSLRGLHSTLALEAGATASAVASALGHASFAVTARHYAAPGTLENLRAQRVGASLAGSRQASPPKPEALQILELRPAVVDALQNIKGLKPEELVQLRAVLTALSSDGLKSQGGGRISN